MNQDVVDRINSAGVPNALKAALKDLRQQVDTLLPHLSSNQHRIAFLIGRVIEEATNVDADTHWWEAALDLITKAADGHGRAGEAVERLVEYVKTRPGAKELLVSCGQGEGSPEGFYLKLGFEHIGEKLGHEVVLRLALE
jgi:hypothetical protein